MVSLQKPNWFEKTLFVNTLFKATVAAKVNALSQYVWSSSAWVQLCVETVNIALTN